jgi:acetoin utilization deacetylase AcuC-like enzyme
MGGTLITGTCFRHLTQLLMKLTAATDNPPIFLALEGGYDVTALPECVKEVLAALLNSAAAEQPEMPMSPKVQQLFDEVRRIHSKFGVWT